jgi:multiple sugar transport system permease protein
MTSRSLKPYLYVLPALAVICIFGFLAMGISLWVSLTRYDLVAGSHGYIGLANYREALSGADSFFRAALLNTFYYVVLVVPATWIVSLLLALMAHKVRRAQAAFKTIYFLPTITPMVIVSLVWFQLLGVYGNPLGSVRWAMPAIALLGVWQACGYFMVIFLAALSDIPQDFYDAASIDGANAWQQFRHVTIPLLRNATAFVLVMLIIGAFQVFTQVYIMTNGGPAGSTDVLAAAVFKEAFEATGRTGYACAMAWLMFLCVAVFVAIQMRLTRSGRIYD